MPQRIEDVMTTDPITLSRSASLRQAAELMRDRDIGDVLVVDDDGDLCGIVTDRDLVVRGVADGRDVDQTPLDDICNHEVVSVTSSDAVTKAVTLMEEHAIRRLPVLDRGQLVGILSIGDLAMERDPSSALGEISSAPPNN